MAMKRTLFSIFMIAVGLFAFSQSLRTFVSLRPSYPVAIGEKSSNGIVVSNNGLSTFDILQDSLPNYEIGHICAQKVRYTQQGHGFYVKSDSLHSLNVRYSFFIDNPPKGKIEFNENTGRFKYYPSPEDYQTFNITFFASDGSEEVSENVEFNLMPQTKSETYAFQPKGSLPSSSDYTVIAETAKSMFFNNEERTVYSLSISGKDVIFDDGLKNKVWGLNKRTDLYELNVFAERLIIRSSLSLPQTNLTVYAKELIFEDHDTILSCINTTPIEIATLANGPAINGASAGNITLYIHNLQGNIGKRFILNGAKGQSSNRNGVPGNGGDGGVLNATIDLNNYCDFARGGGGVKFDTAEDGSFNTGRISGSGIIGKDGGFNLVDSPYAYLHPYYISSVIRYANDAFINNYNEYALETCHQYRSLINECLSCGDVSKTEDEILVQLQGNLSSIDNLLYRLEQNLDYFGNPVGWTPLLSFEVMLNNFDNEITRAIPTLYMYYWLNHIDNTLEHKVEACQFAASSHEQEIKNNQNLINTLVLEIPVLQDYCSEIASQIDDLTQKAELIRNRLLSKAKHNVKKRNRINKTVGVCKNIINCIPVYGQAINIATNIAFATGIANDLLGIDDYGISSIFNEVDTVNYHNILKNLSVAIDTITWKNMGANPNLLKDTYNSLNKSIAPLVNSINNINSLLAKSSTPQNEVDAELQRLLAESADFNQIIGEIQILNQKKNDLINQLAQINTDIFRAVSEINNDVIALDVFRRDAFSGNSKRDLNAMLFIENMEQKAKSRLLKYHYYLRKAYEYRLLKPCEGEFNLVGMFERFESLGMALDDAINENAYASLGSIFREVISDMVEKIVDEYSVNYPEQSAPITIVVPKEQLDLINNSETVPLNFHEMGIFASDEENVRIVNLGIQHIETHVEGNIGYSGYMDLSMTHSGISQYRKDGQLFWFDHIPRNSSSPHTWGIRYDAVSNETTTIQPSAASSSLLSSILGNNGNIMLFSRPSAWGDISLMKKVHSSGGGDVVIDSLVLKLQYDFTHRPNSIRNIDITANDGLLPYITCSEEDINGRSNGNGNLYRSYKFNSQPVKFSAINQYGAYHFLNWSDRSGKIVSNKNELTVACNKDQFYVANYERRVPILQVPDTIQVGHTGGKYTVNVNNIGSGDIEMDWYVSDSLSSWVHLNGETSGFNQGRFTFSYDANPSGVNRVDSLEIFAPETDLMTKIIYIAQVDNPVNSEIPTINVGQIEISVSPIPMRDIVSIKGRELLTIQLFSLTGVEMLRVNVGGTNSAIINVNSLPNGFYIMNVTSKEGMTSKKLLKVI